VTNIFKTHVPLSASNNAPGGVWICDTVRMGWLKRRKPPTQPRRYVQQGRLRQHELMHDLATVGPVTLADVVAAEPYLVRDLVRRKHVEGVLTCDDLSPVAPDVRVTRQFPTKSALLDALFNNVAEREFYHVKRDGVATVVAVLLRPTFEVLTKNIRFRYLAKHGQDSNIVIIVVAP
jgi:hypothetical protein